MAGSRDELRIRSDAPEEAWSEFLERFQALLEGPESGAPRDCDDAWLTENGDPIDPVAFFLAFTGIE